LVLVSLTTTLAVNFSIAERDVSWINEIEDWIKEENWIPDREYVPAMMSSFFLYENGEEQFFLLNSHQEFWPYIEGLVNDIDRRIRYIPREFLDEILAKDKVMAYLLRFPLDFRLFNEYGIAYFILEDKSDMNLEGTIIIRDTQGRLGVWEITNWFL
jgi:hypothetical protein